MGILILAGGSILVNRSNHLPVTLHKMSIVWLQAGLGLALLGLVAFAFGLILYVLYLSGAFA